MGVEESNKIVIGNMHYYQYGTGTGKTNHNKTYPWIASPTVKTEIIKNDTRTSRISPLD